MRQKIAVCFLLPRQRDPNLLAVLAACRRAYPDSLQGPAGQLLL
jgi:hypothetical protein